MADSTDVSVGTRLRRYRKARDLSIRAVAELAGISRSHLSRLETGQIALDSRSQAVALAEALGIAPQDLIGLPVPLPADPATDTAMGAVRAAVRAVALDAVEGEIQPIEQLTARVLAIAEAKQQCRDDEVGAALPSLIIDLHTLIRSGQHVAEALRLAVWLHHSATQAYLQGIGAPADLSWSAARLTGEAAEQLDDPVARGVAGFGQANGLLGWGSFDLAKTVLDRSSVTVGQDPQLAGMLTLTKSLLATATGDSSGARAALDTAAEVAERTGEGNAHWMSFGPTNVATWRLSNALEARDYQQAAALSAKVDPSRIKAPSRRANYWVNHARTMARLRDRQDEAVVALRKAELISAHKVRRNPIARDLLSELSPKVRHDPMKAELRGMMYRSGLRL